jgi:hypothetical protein
MSVMDIVAELLTGSPEIRNDSQLIRNSKTQGSQGFSQDSQDSQPKVMNIQDYKPQKALGYGCAGCGNRIYEMVQAWEISELPASFPWKHEHTPVVHWQCENCKTIYEIIGGNRGPKLIQ